MNVKPEEVEYKKKVGTLDGNAVIEVGLKGGLCLVFVAKGGSFPTLGSGPHRAVARFIANKKAEGRVQWTDLSKADHVEPEFFADILPYYEALTNALRAAQGL